VALDNSRVIALQYYRLSDYVLRLDPEGRNARYAYLRDHLNATYHTPVVWKIVDRERACYHFDAIRLIPGPEKVMPEDMAARVVDGTAFEDPFAPGKLLGYQAIMCDFRLVSVGPDGYPDILGFTQDVDGTLRHPDGEPVARHELQELVKDFEPWVGSLSQAAFERHVPIDLLYDPTNGIASKGDILFERRARTCPLLEMDDVGILQWRHVMELPLPGEGQ